MLDVTQGSTEWKNARLGKVTASRISDVMAKGGGVVRKRYMAELMSERLTGNATECYQSPSMEWGIEQEPKAVKAYEFFNEVQANVVGFVEHPEIQMAGASPDRLIGENGIIEIKCPDTHTHIYNMLNSHVDSKYVKQIQFQLACTGRAWCDFVSFDPRLPPAQQLFVKRIERDKEFIVEMETEVLNFLTELNESLEKLETR